MFQLSLPLKEWCCNYILRGTCRAVFSSSRNTKWKGSGFFLLPFCSKLYRAGEVSQAIWQTRNTMLNPSLVPGDKRDQRQPRRAAAAPAAAPRCQGGGRAPQPPQLPNIPPRLSAGPSTAPAPPARRGRLGRKARLRAAVLTVPRDSGAEAEKKQAPLPKAVMPMLPSRPPSGTEGGVGRGREVPPPRARARLNGRPPSGRSEAGPGPRGGGAGMQGAWPERLRTNFISGRGGGSGESSAVTQSESSARGREGGAKRFRTSERREKRGRRSWCWRQEGLEQEAGFRCPNPRGPNCDKATAGAATANQAARCR